MKSFKFIILLLFLSVCSFGQKIDWKEIGVKVIDGLLDKNNSTTSPNTTNNTREKNWVGNDYDFYGDTGPKNFPNAIVVQDWFIIYQSTEGIIKARIIKNTFCPERDNIGENKLEFYSTFNDCVLINIFATVHVNWNETKTNFKLVDRYISGKQCDADVYQLSKTNLYFENCKSISHIDYIDPNSIEIRDLKIGQNRIIIDK